MSCKQDVETTRPSSVGKRETRDLKAWSTGEVPKELGWSGSPGLGENQEHFQESQVYRAKGFGFRKRRGSRAC